MAAVPKGSPDPFLPLIRTRLPGPAAQKVLAQDHQYVSPSYTRPYPLVAQRGRGAIIEDADGNRLYVAARCST